MYFIQKSSCFSIALSDNRSDLLTSKPECVLTILVPHVRHGPKLFSNHSLTSSTYRAVPTVPCGLGSSSSSVTASHSHSAPQWLALLNSYTGSTST